MPATMPATEARGELERPEHTVRNDGQNVEHHRKRRREEPRILRRHLGATRQLSEACGAGNCRHNAECDEARRNEPARPGRIHDGSVLSSIGRQWAAALAVPGTTVS